MKNVVLSLVVFITLFYSGFINAQWTQLGGDVDGEGAGDNSGYSVSMSADGSIMAVGAPYNNSNTGQVRVYEYNGSNWIQLGSDIDGEAGGDLSGYSVNLSKDGMTVIIGAYGNDDGGYDHGQVRVYEYNGSNWVQKGGDLNGTSDWEYFGRSVSISADGNIIAVGADGNDAGGGDAGQVKVFEYNGSNWVQLGANINGESAGDYSGYVVDLNDAGNVLAIGAYGNDGNGSNSGHVRVFAYTGTVWMQVGADIDGEAAGDNSGRSVCLNADGSKIAIGADGNDGNGANSGHVRVYEFTGVWSQVGQDIDGETGGDQSGYSVSLNGDGNIVAIGAWLNDGYAPSAGHVRIYEYTGINWIQKGGDIDGEMGMDYSGHSVSISSSGRNITIGAIGNDGSYADAGHVRVYTCNSYTNLTEMACESYTSPSGNYTWTASGTYHDTIANGMSCSEFITIDLTVNYNSSSIITETACDSYTSPSGTYTWTSSGTYNDTIPNYSGCDSIITINLTVNNSNTGDTTAVACDGFDWYGTNYTTSGDYTRMFTNTYGCDSLVTLHLTINNSNTGDTTAVACDSFDWYGTNYTTSGDYTRMFTNTYGCDSLVTLHLTINNSNTGDTTAIACDSFDWYGTNYTTSGDYTRMFTNTYGCDSLVTLHLTINNSNTSSIITETACDSYTSPSGTYTWTSSGTYNDTIPNYSGCDSIITINLTVNNSNTGDTTAVACDSFDWYGTNYTVTGDYTRMFTNTYGCDSLVTLHLTINNSNTGDTTAVACDSFDWYGTNYTASGDYTRVFTNMYGCDSLVTLHLTINNSNTGDTTAIACDSFDWYGTNYTTSGDYTRMFTNMYGCDSLVTLHLTINNSNTGDTTAIACDSFDWYGTNYTASGDYTRMFTNMYGCDSLVTLHLTINNSNTGDTTAVACNSFDWYGTTYTSSGYYTHTLTNIYGCDSIVNLNLTINTVSISVTVNDPQITADAVGANYQWLDCNNGFAPLSGEISQSFTATVNGNYAVEVTENGCADTSACVSIISIDIINTMFNSVEIYPNPNRGIINIDFGGLSDPSVQIYTIEGKLIYEQENIKTKELNLKISEKPGVYFIEITSESQKQRYKLLKL